MKRTLSLLLAIGFLLAGIPGCIGSPADVALENRVTTGPEQGTLLVLGSAEEEYVRGMVRAFESETGIRTEYVRRSAGEALGQLQAEKAAPTASVWWGGSVDNYNAATGLGLLEPYKPRGFAKIPSQYKDPNGMWTGVYVGVLAFAVNTRLLQAMNLPEPKTWADLTNPVYRGQISMGHPSTSGTGYAIVSTIMQLFGRDTTKGFAYLSALNNNISEYQRAGAMPARLAGRGQVAIGLAFAHDIVAAIEDGLTDLKIVYPSDGTGYEVGGMALVKNAPQPELAKKFMDWALSEHAEELGPVFTAYQIPTNPDAKVGAKSAKLSQIKTIDYDFTWSGNSREALVTRFIASVAPPSNLVNNLGPQNR